MSVRLPFRFKFVLACQCALASLTGQAGGLSRRVRISGVTDEKKLAWESTRNSSEATTDVVWINIKMHVTISLPSKARSSSSCCCGEGEAGLELRGKRLPADY